MWRGDFVAMTVENVQVVIRWIAAALFALWHAVPYVTQLLLLLMVIDAVLGSTVAIVAGGFSVDVARRGAGKKIATLAYLSIAAFAQPYAAKVGIDFVQAASIFYLLPELGSVTRNAALLGAPTFPQLETLLGRFTGTATGQQAIGNSSNQQEQITKDKNNQQ